MPYINIKVTDEQVTKQQKQQLIAGATQLVVGSPQQKPRNHACRYRRSAGRQLGRKGNPVFRIKKIKKIRMDFKIKP